MSKKNFKTSFDNLLLPESKDKRSHNTNKEIRATFVVKQTSINKLKAVAYWESKMNKEVLDEALSQYFENYESKNGPIRLPK